MTSTTDPVAVLDALRPPTPLDPEGLERVRTRVIAQTGQSRTSRHGRVPHRRALAGVSAIAAAGVVGLVAVQAMPTPPAAATPPLLPYETSVLGVVDGTAQAGGEVAQALATAAGAADPASDATSVSLVESAYWNTDIARESDDGDLQMVVVPVQRTVWASTQDGSMRFREVVGTPLDADGQVELPDVTVSGPEVLDYTLPADHDRGPLAAELLPTDPDDLAQTVVTGSRPPHGCEPGTEIECLAAALGDLTQIGPVPADLQSAFWAAIGQQSGLYTLGTTTDRLDREGVTLAYLDAVGGTIDVLIADPDTGALLGTESIDVTGDITDADEPAVWWMEVFQPVRWVADLQSS